MKCPRCAGSGLGVGPNCASVAQGCRYCDSTGVVECRDAGDWYAHQAEDARRLSRELREAKERGDCPATIRQLELKLERARYVGD